MPLAIAFALLRRSDLPWISRTMGLVIDTIRSLPLLSIMFTFAIVLPFVLPGWLIGDKLYRVIFGYALFFACYQAEIMDGQTCVGRVTASGWSPYLESGIGYVRFNEAGDWAGKSLFMKTKHGVLASCEIVPLPFYDAEKRIPRDLKPADPG
jgi:hypothetical protein